MKKILIFAAILLGFITGSIFAKSQLQPVVKLYAEPEAQAKVIAELKPDARLVPIFRQKDWVKVGVRKNGEVGWVNQKQYSEALQQFYQPEIHTFYVQSSEADNKGKPVINIVAYKNGKRISDAEAKAMYEKLRQQQQIQWQQMRQFDEQLQRQMNWEFGQLQRMIQPFPVLEPGVVITDQK